MRRLIAVRQEYKAFGRGTWEPLDAANRRVLVFLRRYRDETILCVNNLSRFAQFVELDLQRIQGHGPARAVEQVLLSSRWRAAVSVDARAAQLPVVPAPPIRTGQRISTLHVTYLLP